MHCSASIKNIILLQFTTRHHINFRFNLHDKDNNQKVILGCDFLSHIGMVISFKEKCFEQKVSEGAKRKQDEVKTMCGTTSYPGS